MNSKEPSENILPGNPKKICPNTRKDDIQLLHDEKISCLIHTNTPTEDYILHRFSCTMDTKLRLH